jgi:carbon-monoxide dehydrogenase catalytic subunit
MVAGGAAAHSDHGRCVAEVFLSAARKETEAYKIKDVNKLLAIAPYLGVATTVEVDGEDQRPGHGRDRPGSGAKAMNEWGKAEGELHYLKRAPKPLYEKWKKQGVCRETSTGKSLRSCTAPTWAWIRITKT